LSAAFLKALLFGVVVAGSIGPIALLVFGTAARRGFASGAFASLGAATADLLYAAVAFSSGALLLPALTAHGRAIRIGCALLLVALGLRMLLRSAPEAAGEPASAASAFWPTFLLTLVNPMTIVLFTGVVPQLPVAGSPATAARLAFALFLGSLGVQCVIAAAGAAAGAALPGGWRRAINVGSALGILGFGIAGLAGA